ncbi:MAG TPA: Swt1 family HEPN domain-containing protein [Planctomicrobium sp.]|nr:Swt1 family HEPN domain-containing protein [Planctomicrobium sp.]
MRGQSQGVSVETYRGQITTAMDLLTAGLAPYVEAKLRAIHRDNWIRIVSQSFRDDRGRIGDDSVEWDAHSLLTVMWDQWNTAFRNDLGHFERSLVSELREVRNRWAHQQDFDFDDAYRVLDSVQRLLAAIKAENVGAVKREKIDLLESHVADAVNTQVQRNAFRRNKWWVITFYAFCCAVVMFHGLKDQGTGSYAIVSIVFLIFLYLIYQQFKMEPPLLYGPRECRRCHRIVYRKTCPYCEAE